MALALSVALVGPTLAMSGNGQGLIGTVGKSIPLVFLIGLVGVSLVGYSFVRLTRHLNHAGSSYGLVGGTIGPRAGFFAGFAMLGAYWMFSIGTLALTAAFTNAFIAELQPDSENPYQPPWLVIVVIAAVISFLLAGRDIRLLAKILLAIEGLGILAMVVLVVVIFAKGGAPSTGIDFSVFSFSGSGVSRPRCSRASSRRSCPGRASRRARRWARRPTTQAATSRGRWRARCCSPACCSSS